MIVEHIGEPALYEGIAEEASELSAAASKVARILRGDNPTEIQERDAKAHVVEELTHLMMYCNDAVIFPNNVIAQQALERFEMRWKAKNNAKI